MRWLDKLTDAASENLHVVRQTPWAFGICLLALLIPICALTLVYKRFVVDGRFDATRDFEYRDYVLHLEKADFHTFIVGGVGVRKEAENARAKIVARR